jgi:hypothetical protein
MNNLRTGLLIDKKQKHKCRVLTEKLHDTGARLEHTPRKTEEQELELELKRLECQSLV